MRIHRKLIFRTLTSLLLLVLVAAPFASAKKLNVVTSTTDLAALAQEVGGDNITVGSIPTGQVTRAMGDVHPLGNPHYWLDPDNGRRVAKGIMEKLSELDPSNSAVFEQRFADFDKRLTAAEKNWEAQMQPYRGRKVVTYHRSWPNFAKHFGLNVVGYIEPRPGIPPTPSHTIDLINLMKRENVKVLLIEPYFDLRTPNSIATQTGAKVLVMTPSVGGEKGLDDYFKLFDYDIGLLKQAFDSVK